MPTNQQRRDAAKRKLERQLVRRQERLKSRRQRTIIASVIVGVIVVAGVVWFITKKPSDADNSASGGSATSASETTPTEPCVYTDSPEGTVKAVNKPDNTNPLTAGTVEATITLGQGALPVTLDRSLAPCAVNAFISLASQKFYDSTSCIRLTTDENFKILQCGDPSGTGRGGPGYSYAGETNPELTADTAAPSTSADPTATAAAAVDQYPVGTLAMANTAAAGANGSQFFIVYGESDLGASGYTKIGTVSADGLAVIDQIAAKGTVANASGVLDKPAEAVDISSVSVPEDALTPTQPAPETTASTDATDGLPTDAVPTDNVPTGSDATDTGGASGADTAPSDPASSDPAASDPASSQAAGTTVQ